MIFVSRDKRARTTTLTVESTDDYVSALFPFGDEGIVVMVFSLRVFIAMPVGHAANPGHMGAK